MLLGQHLLQIVAACEDLSSAYVLDASELRKRTLYVAARLC